MDIKNIVIIGGGVIGTTCAVKLIENLGSTVTITIVSDQFSPNTTGNISAGLWGPFLLNNTPEEKIIKWSKCTHKYFHKLWKSGQAANAGISLLLTTRVSTISTKNDFWKDIVYGAQELTDNQLNQLKLEHNRDYKHGLSFTTFTCEPDYFLPFLYERFKLKGGQMIQRKIESLNELNDFDLIINCSGLGAKQIMDDNKMKPIRGQVARVKAPWEFSCILDESDDGNYIIPNIDTVILGGTHQIDDYNLKNDENDTRFIMNGCTKLRSCLKNAKVVKKSVGLRPGRSSVCLRLDSIETKIGKHVPVIHNYGHGGSGVTLSWGCAEEVYDIFQSLTKEKLMFKSKL